MFHLKLKNFKEVLTILGTIFLTLLYYSIFLPTFIILLIHRHLVICFAKLVKPDWIPTSIVGGALAIDMQNESQIHSLSITGEFGKPCDPRKLKKRVQKYLSGNENPELKSYFTRWMGIFFLKPCTNFTVSSIFKVDLTTDVKDMEKLTKSSCTPSFEVGQPPWEIVVFPNVMVHKVVLTLRAHHGLFDGISCMRLMQELSDDGDVQLQTSISQVMDKYLPQLTWESKLRIGLEFLFLTPWQLSYAALKLINVNTWTISGCFGRRIQLHKRFNKTRIQTIAKKLGHHATVIFSGALIGAIRKEMKARGDSVDQELSLLYVLPSTEHAHKKLSNYLILTPVRFPINVEDRKHRLVLIDETFQKLRKPAWILQCDLVTKFCALVVSLLAAKTLPKYFGSGGWTNLSTFGCDQRITFKGRKGSNYVVNIGMQAQGLPVLITSVLFQDEIFFSVNTHQSLFPEEEGLQQFLDRVENELVLYSAM